MSGCLKHRPVSSSRSVRSTSAAARENNGLASASQQAIEKKKLDQGPIAVKDFQKEKDPRSKLLESK